jgi:hypothetical protein
MCNRPYLHIFGELYIEWYLEDSACVGPWEFTSCGSSTTWLLPFLLGLQVDITATSSTFLAIYAMVTNVMLISLLTTMFSQTVCVLCFLHLITLTQYSTVQEHSQNHWNFLIYGMASQNIVDSDLNILQSSTRITAHGLCLLGHWRPSTSPRTSSCSLCAKSEAFSFQALLKLFSDSARANSAKEESKGAAEARA